MRLEEIARSYGMNDYYEMSTGRTYLLSKAMENPDGTLSVPVLQGGVLIGHCTMEKVRK
jgi:hypothetical protein